MNPHPDKGNTPTTDVQIAYLKRLLNVMLAEDQQRGHQRTVGFENTKLVRRIPVISEAYLNPVAIHFKKLQEDEIKDMAQPKDHPWYARLHLEYMGKLLYDRGCFKGKNKGKNVFPCWEATTEPVSKNVAGEYLVLPKYLVATSDDSKKFVKSAEVTHPHPYPYPYL
jgi:hypothetical protein